MSVPCSRVFVATLTLLCLARYSAAKEAETTLPSAEELVEQLRAPEPAVANAAYQSILKRLATERKEFLPVLSARAQDTDPAVRRRVAILLGEFFIWRTEEQDTRVIDLLLQMTRDPDDKVVYACVYYGLSTVTEKSDALIDRLVELASAKPPGNAESVLDRVRWGLRADVARAVPRIQRYLDSLDPKETKPAALATQLCYQLSGTVPDNVERFQDEGDYIIMVALQSPFAPRTRQDAEAIVRAEIGRREPDYECIAWFDKSQRSVVVRARGLANYAHVLRSLAGVEGFSCQPIPLSFLAPDKRADFEKRLRELRDRADPPAPPPPPVPYPTAFREIHERLGRDYPNFALKRIDWQAVGAELLPESQSIETPEEFSLLCQRLVARLEDSHAVLGAGTAKPAAIPLPRWDGGFACLWGDGDRPLIYHIVPGSPAALAGLEPGMTVLTVNGRPTTEAIAATMDLYREYIGYSSDRVLRYDAVRGFARQRRRGEVVKLEVERVGGEKRQVDLVANQEAGYVPRLPVPIPGINDSADFAAIRLEDGIGYLRVRRIRDGLIESLDRAVQDLRDCHGLIIDVRGNSGGGFDAARSFRNFDSSDAEEPTRPRFSGPIAILIDARCISAGEGWVSWFAARKRGRFFGETTAGASSRKATVDVAGGLFRVTYPVKAYTGFLDRPIERLGIEPDVPVRATAADLARGVDTVIQAARGYLRDQARSANGGR